MKTLKEFIAEVADAKTVPSLHKVALEIAETTFFGKEQNERLRAWVAEGKNPRGFKTHLVNMLQIAERSSRIEIPADLEVKAKNAGDKNFFPPISATTTLLTGLPESEQQKMYKNAVITGLPHTVNVFTQSTLDQINLYQALKEEDRKQVKASERQKKKALAKKAKLRQTISENVHALIELLQNQVHVDITKSSNLWDIYTSERLKNFAEIQDFLNKEEMGNLQLVYELYRFAIKSNYYRLTPYSREYITDEAKAVVLNEKLEPSSGPISSDQLMLLFKVRHPNLAKFTDPNVKYKIIDEDRLSVHELDIIFRTYGKEASLLALLRNISPDSIIRLIIAAGNCLDANTSIDSKFMTSVFSFTTRGEGERIIREKVSSGNQPFFTLCHVLSELELDLPVSQYSNLESQMPAIFSKVLKQAEDCIDGFLKGKETTKDVIVSVERLLKLFKIASEKRIPLPLDKIARLQNIQRFLDAQKDNNGQSAGTKLPVLHLFGRIVVSSIVFNIGDSSWRRLFFNLFSEDESASYEVGVRGFANEFSTEVLENFLGRELRPNKHGRYNLQIIKMAFLFRHPEMNKLKAYVNTAHLLSQSLEELFVFSATHNLNDLLWSLLEKPNFHPCARGIADYLKTEQPEFVDSKLVFTLVGRLKPDERQQLFANHDVLKHVIRLEKSKLAFEIIKLMNPIFITFQHFQDALCCNNPMLDVARVILAKFSLPLNARKEALAASLERDDSKTAIFMLDHLRNNDLFYSSSYLFGRAVSLKRFAVLEAMHKKLSNDNTDWSEHTRFLFKSIKEGSADSALEIIRHLPRHQLFVTREGSTPLDFALKYARHDVVEAIRTKLRIGTGLEKAISSRQAIPAAAASTAIGQTSSATNANVSMRHPMDGIDPMGIMQSRSSGCSIV